MTHALVQQLKGKMESSAEALKKDLVKIRTGRASLSLVEGIKVNAYGSRMSLDQVGSMTIPENNVIAIKPWDPQILPAIEKAILSSGIGLTPSSDGNVIRLILPALTGERRKELVKQIKKIGEEYKVAVRNIRRDANEALKKLKKDKEISEDEMFRLQEESQKSTDSFISLIDEIVGGKEKEVMEL